MSTCFLVCSSGVSENLKSSLVFKLEFLNYDLSLWHFWRKWVMLSAPCLAILHLLLLMKCVLQRCCLQTFAYLQHQPVLELSISGFLCYLILLCRARWAAGLLLASFLRFLLCTVLYLSLDSLICNVLPLIAAEGINKPVRSLV